MTLGGIPLLLPCIARRMIKNASRFQPSAVTSTDPFRRKASLSFQPPVRALLKNEEAAITFSADTFIRNSFLFVVFRARFLAVGVASCVLTVSGTISAASITGFS